MDKKQQLRVSLANFLGAMAAESDMPPRPTRHELVAVLAEEGLKLCDDDKGSCDTFVSKPLFRGVIHLLRLRLYEMESSSVSSLPAVQASAQSYRQTIAFLESVVEKAESVDTKGETHGNQ